MVYFADGFVGLLVEIPCNDDVCCFSNDLCSKFTELFLVLSLQHAVVRYVSTARP